MTASTTRSRRVRVGIGLAAVAAAVGVAAGPALGVVGSADGQPPPGTDSPKVSDFEPGGQPPAGSGGSAGTDFVLGGQPAGPAADPPTGRTAQYTPDEPASGAAVQRDKGVPGLRGAPE